VVQHQHGVPARRAIREEDRGIHARWDDIVDFNTESLLNRVFDKPGECDAEGGRSGEDRRLPDETAAAKQLGVPTGAFQIDVGEPIVI
jgi:hypothetical protein